MATNHKVGGEIDAFCNKDKMTLAHTIIAMVGEKVVRVQCNTCGSQHAYRGTAATAPKKPRASSAKSGEAKPSRATVTFDQLMSEKDAGSAKKYSAKDTYAKDDLIDHPTFGMGIVQEARSDKVTVLFKMDEKTLVHGRGGAPAAKPVFAAPRSAIKGPADKPMPDGAAAPEAGGAEEPAAAEGEGAGEAGASTEG